MTKLSTRNAKNTIIELVIIVRIVVTHKLPQFEDVNPGVTLWPFLASETICAGKRKKQSSLFNSGPICRNPLLKFRLALSERHRSLVDFKVQHLLKFEKWIPADRPAIKKAALVFFLT